MFNGLQQNSSAKRDFFFEKENLLTLLRELMNFLGKHSLNTEWKHIIREDFIHEIEEYSGEFNRFPFSIEDRMVCLTKKLRNKTLTPNNGTFNFFNQDFVLKYIDLFKFILILCIDITKSCILTAILFKSQLISWRRFDFADPNWRKIDLCYQFIINHLRKIKTSCFCTLTEC